MLNVIVYIIFLYQDFRYVRTVEPGTYRRTFSFSFQAFSSRLEPFCFDRSIHLFEQLNEIELNILHDNLIILEGQKSIVTD
jgi:hypothetical protein